MRTYLLLTGITLAILATAATAADRHRVEFPGKGYLWVVGGKVCVVPRPIGEDYDWGLTRGASAIPIQVLKPREWEGWRLAYDPEGKDKAVFLAEKLGPGTDWKLTLLKGEEEADHTIQAAAGKVKGWYLDVAEKAEEFTDAKGRRYTAYRVFLSEKPKRLPKVILNVIAP